MLLYKYIWQTLIPGPRTLSPRVSARLVSRNPKPETRNQKPGTRNPESKFNRQNVFETMNREKRIKKILAGCCIAIQIFLTNTDLLVPGWHVFGRAQDRRPETLHPPPGKANSNHKKRGLTQKLMEATPACRQHVHV